MIRVEWFCKRCGKKIDEKEYSLKPGYEDVNPGAITDDFCEDCLVEYEALKCRQAEERRMFWEEYTENE